MLISNQCKDILKKDSLANLSDLEQTLETGKSSQGLGFGSFGGGRAKSAKCQLCSSRLLFSSNVNKKESVPNSHVRHANKITTVIMMKEKRTPINQKSSATK